jgi:hypothetical protein
VSSSGPADLGDELVAQLLLLALESRLQLVEALLAEGAIGRPRRGVEGPARRGDGRLHVGARTVGHHAKHLFGGGVDVVEGLAALAVDELPVDEKPALATLFSHQISSRLSMDRSPWL